MLFLDIEPLEDGLDGLFDRLLDGGGRTVKRYQGEQHPLAPKFQGRELPVEVQIAAAGRRDETDGGTERAGT